MSDVKQQTEGAAEVARVRPRPPEREPKGEADWRVSVRHTPLKFKTAVVRAAGRKAAWTAFLDAAEAATTEEAFKANQEQLRHAREWLANARRQPPDGVELLSEEYRKGRLLASQAKGTLTPDAVGGYTELASAPGQG